VQTESFEHSEQSKTSNESSVGAASPQGRFFSASLQLARAKGLPKKQSTQNTQFAHVLLLFLLLNVFPRLFVFIEAPL
jgi:hypothetical protein